MGPERLTVKGLPNARRGYDHKAVERLLEEARQAWTNLQQEHRRLMAEIEQAGGLEYLSRDLGAVGAEVGRVLADAQEAARGLRERARVDSAQQLTAAAAEAQRLVAEAEQQAFRARAGAWNTGMDLLHQALETGRAIVKEASSDALIVRAEAEQEAHRLVASARRESQDVLREARFAAERTMLEARTQMEQSVPVEAPAPDPAPEPGPPASSTRRRHRAPEVAPTEIPDVIRVIQPNQGGARVARAGIDPGAYGDSLAAEVEALWGSGEVLGVPEGPSPAPSGDVLKSGSAAEEPPRGSAPSPVKEEPVEEPTVEPRAEEAPALEPLAVAEEPAAAGEEAPGEVPSPELPPKDGGEVAPAGTTPAAPAPPAVAPEPSHGGVEELFARLRTTHRPGGRRRRGSLPGDATLPGLDLPATVSSDRVALPDAIELRERLVLPVQNRALRRVKENLLELQNAALDGLRTSGAWEGGGVALASLAPALDPVAEEAAEAGAQAVAAFTGGEPPAAVIGARSAGLVQAMAEELTAQVDAAVGETSGAGPLEVAAAVSRVFRAWRAEEAERWVRTVAYAAYHDSLLAGLAVAGVKQVTSVAHGLLCAECPAFRGLSWDPAGEPPEGAARPPAHPDCACTVAPV